MQKLPKRIVGFVVLGLAGIFLFYHLHKTEAAAASHVVISEIQVAGVGSGASDDEFVELYNPTDTSVDLTGWRLTRQISNGGSLQNLVASFGTTIAAHGYLLIADTEYTGNVAPDITYASSSAITANNIITLKDDSQTIVDLVGMGTAVSSESATAVSPDDGQSIERKAQASSTAETMMTGGADEFMGNGEDTDNNAADFVVRTTPDPQNSSSPAEVLSEPTETPTPTEEVSPTVTPIPTEEVTPSLTPTVEPTVTETPTPTPTEEVSPTPTETEAPTPTPTEEVTPTPEPTMSPTPTPTGTTFAFFSLTCGYRYHYISFFGRTIVFPYITCWQAF